MTIEAALQAIDALDIGEKPRYAEIARKYGVDRSTLSRRHRGVCASRKQANDQQRHLNNAQELELVRYIDKLVKRGLPPTREMIRNFAAEIAQVYVGKNWADRFIERHKIHLISRWASGIDNNRHKADSAEKYKLFFELLEQKIEQYNIQPQHMYNMDEKGFLIGILSKMKRIFTRRRYESGEAKNQLQDGNREWITLLACVCADGTALTPALIYQAASGKLQDSWLQDFNDSKDKCFFASSKTGWTSNELGLAWLQQVFDPETSGKARRQYRLLILDGHGSHVTMAFIDYCDKHKILLLVFPPHSTHTLQPLDVVMFAPLAGAYSRALSEFMDKCQGLSSITKRDFFRLFSIAWSVAFHSKNITKSFSATGLYPLDPQAILARFESNELITRPSTSDSATSVLSASEWRKIERLLQKVVVEADNLRDKRVKKMSHTIHAMSVQTSLLQHENERLREALLNEKKRRQRGKPLLLEAPKEYKGGAVFYSPSKVGAARARQAQKELEEAEKQHNKTERAKLREEEKQLKAQILEERRQARAAAKIVKDADNAKKAIEKEQAAIDREVAKQLQEDIKLSKKSDRQSIKPIVRSKKPTIVVVDDGEPAAAEVGGPTAATITSRRGRSIKLPAKYK